MSTTLQTSSRAHFEHDGRSHSEIPASEPPPHLEQVLPPPGTAGGLENIPEELLSKSEAASDELDHAGLDSQLPAEDQAPPSTAQNEDRHAAKETWGHL